jgi:cytochrome c
MSQPVERAVAASSRQAGRRDLWWLALILAGLAAAALVAYAYHRVHAVLEQRQAAVALTGGDPDRGAAAIRQFGCGGCHTIAGIADANGLVGPDLSQTARRIYVAGVLTNGPEHLMAFIVDPKSVDAKTAMPVTGISPEQARDVAAYLYAIAD